MGMAPLVWTLKQNFASFSLPNGGSRHLLFIAFAALTVGVYILFVVTAATNMHNRVGLGGAPLFYDFTVFHQVGQMAATGHAADAYDDGKMLAAQHAAFPGSRLRLPWNYPPTFQLMLMPFGVLPYAVAWLIWSCVLYGCYALLTRRLVDDPLEFGFLLLAPGAAVNLFVGQNGILSAVLMGTGVLLLGSRPIIAGILLGMMAYKPQFAVLIPLALLAGKEFRALAAAIVSQAALMLLSAMVLSTGPWLAFLQRITHASTVFSSSSSDWRGIPSVMILARTLGMSEMSSTFCHWTVAALASILVVWTWLKTGSAALRLATLATATVLVTPYLRGYDMVLLVLPAAALMSLARLGIAEKAVILCAWLMPAILTFVPSRIQFGPLVSLAMLAVVIRHMNCAGSAREAAA
jgi:alpha-1,2-mannosyltransferase